MTKWQEIQARNKQRVSEIETLQRKMEAPCQWCCLKGIDCDSCNSYRGYPTFLAAVIEPLPCLKCGTEEVEAIEYADIGKGDPPLWRCVCKNGHEWSEGYTTKEEAIESWNERPE